MYFHTNPVAMISSFFFFFGGCVGNFAIQWHQITSYCRYSIILIEAWTIKIDSQLSYVWTNNSYNEVSVHLSLPNHPRSLQYSYICSYSKKMIYHCHSKGCSSTNEDKMLDCSPAFSDLSVNCQTQQTWVLYIKNGYEYLILFTAQ